MQERKKSARKNTKKGLNDDLDDLGVNKTKYKIYDKDPLIPTGPGVLLDINKIYNKKIIGQLKNNLFIYNNQKIILHKCNECDKSQNWINGNNYNVLWYQKKFFNNFIKFISLVRICLIK